nr:MAG TPA: hypothetical protein [Caudoviricetes sp.]DAH45013.1 MAG TPA: hypothetical protein [Caudoviricetes sp.]
MPSIYTIYLNSKPLHGLCKVFAADFLSNFYVFVIMFLI